TGKEIISRLVHFGENGLEEPYNSINCTSITPSLFESELFGYEGGAYTGSKSVGMSGKLELAGAGTVLFDEIGDLPLELQPKLLKVIEERRFYRVGGLKEISLEARIIAATNRDLKVMISQGSFRKDLYHRLNTGCINIPSLREQRESIIPLAQMFLNEFSRRRRRLFKFIGKSAAELLQSCQWNGNIRELRNLIDRVTLLFNEVELQPAHLDSAEFYSSSDSVNNIPILKIGGFELPDEGLNLQNLESEIVRKVLEKFNGNKSKTAAYLGLTVSSLRSRL
ncbi:MAG: hypothetical protein QG635_1450, partial [Bacteroidota bacterium]|nr:hypothetical protein [Bacteroidota bacterium]